MKICIIGNCHTIGIYGAWRDGLSSDHPDVSITFFFHGGGWFGQVMADRENRTLKIESEKVRTKFKKVSGGEVNVDLRKFDVVLIVGGFFHRPVGQIAALRADRRYSGQVIAATVKDIFAQTHASTLLSKIREISDLPVYMIHNPFRASGESTPLEQLKSPFETYDYARGINLLNEIALFPAGAEMLAQPDETLAAPYSTKHKFAVGWRKPLRVEVKAGFDGDVVDDLAHTNTNYGELRIEQLLQRLGSGSG